MAKRFTDNEKWKKPFIRGLKAPYKLLWLYILDECDHAGIWQVDFQIAEIKIGERLKENQAIEQFGDKILIFSNGEKWFINDFIEFQYGVLNPQNRVHLSVLNSLRKYSLIDENNQIKPLTSPLQRAKDKDKEQDKEKETPENKKLEFIDGFEKIVQRWLNYKTSRNEKYKSDDSIMTFYNKLLKLSDSSPKIAIEIIEQSMANNWAGIFELKKEEKTVRPDISGQQ